MPRAYTDAVGTKTDLRPLRILRINVLNVRPSYRPYAYCWPRNFASKYNIMTLSLIARLFSISLAVFQYPFDGFRDVFLKVFRNSRVSEGNIYFFSELLFFFVRFRNTSRRLICSPTTNTWISTRIFVRYAFQNLRVSYPFSYNEKYECLVKRFINQIKTIFFEKYS